MGNGTTRSMRPFKIFETSLFLPLSGADRSLIFFFCNFYHICPNRALNKPRKVEEGSSYPVSPWFGLDSIHICHKAQKGIVKSRNKPPASLIDTQTV